LRVDHMFFTLDITESPSYGLTHTFVIGLWADSSDEE